MVDYSAKKYKREPGGAWRPKYEAAARSPERGPWPVARGLHRLARVPVGSKKIMKMKCGVERAIEA